MARVIAVKCGLSIRTMNFRQAAVVIVLVGNDFAVAGSSLGHSLLVVILKADSPLIPRTQLPKFLIRATIEIERIPLVVLVADPIAAIFWATREKGRGSAIAILHSVVIRVPLQARAI